MIKEKACVSDCCIQKLAKNIPPLSPDTPIDTLGDVLSDPLYTESLSFPVVNSDRIPVGSISRYRILQIFIRPYGRELFGRRPISEFMDVAPLQVKAQAPLAKASQCIFERLTFPITEDFIIVDGDHYAGMGTVMDLFQAVNEIKFRDYDGALTNKVVELENLTQQLHLTSQEAQIANRAKSTFLANMSHELRTPLNAIIGYTELIGDEFRDTGQNEHIEDLDKVSSAGKHLLNLINSILDLSKIEAGHMTLCIDTISVPTLVSDLVSICQPLMQKNHNQLDIELPEESLCLQTDEQKLRQSLLNLLSNAAKFSHNEKVTLSVQNVDCDNIPWVEFRVIDHGTGMTPEQATDIFRPFHQLDMSAHRGVEGTGLGLAITQQFCEMLGGKIEVLSEPGIGSEFIIRIPQVLHPTPNTSAII